MKLIVKEYLSSLRERGDLDKSVLPNLLAEIGLRILSTPMIGTRQNGVDIAAVGKIKGEKDGQCLYLFCIKAGNITKRDWSVGEQSVRSQLDEIRDVYLCSNVTDQHADLPIRICLCCGGEIEENVRPNWAGYTKNNQTDRIKYEEWNGDRLADLVMRCLLAGELLEEKPRRSFRKAVAMVSEPGACYEYSRAFLHNLLVEEAPTRKVQLLRLRQAYICLNAVTSWAIEANNFEGIYRVSELGVLLCWNVVHTHLANADNVRPTKHLQTLSELFDQFVRLYLYCSDLYLDKTAYRYSEQLHALSTAVRSKEAIDVNLALFELLGRVVIRAIWTFALPNDLTEERAVALRTSIDGSLDTLVQLINSNPTLNSPFKDDHMIEIALVMYLAQLTDSTPRFIPWLRRVAKQITWALAINSHYPTCFNDYVDLLKHPANDKASYRNEACKGSILYPYLFVWLKQIAEENDIIEFCDRLAEFIPNCTHQAWIPDDETDDLMWKGDTNHGICITGLSPQYGFEHVTETLNLAIENCPAINNIRVLNLPRLGALFFTACRHYRLPIPPHFWTIGCDP